MSRSVHTPFAVKRAMIMSAGKGTRMAPLTDKIPKPLVSFMGRPLIEHALERLQGVGVRQVVVNLHTGADVLEAHLVALQKRKDVPEIIFSDERTTLLDTGGGIKKARPLLGEDAVVTFNSDSVWLEGLGNTLSRLLESWQPDHMDALLMLACCVNTIGECRRGDFLMDQHGRLVRRQEAGVAPFMFAGVQIIKPQLFDAGPDGPFSTNQVWNRLIEKGRLFGMRMDCVWMHVGTPRDLQAAEAFVRARQDTPDSGA